MTLSAMKSAISDLAGEAMQRASEFEADRQLADDFVQRLKLAGIYRVLIPVEAGGLGGSLIDWLEMATRLSHADGSTGWVCGHGAVCSALIYALADREFSRSFFDDPMASASWSNQPQVTVEELPDGLRISGRWGFETGCTSATHVGGMVQLKNADGSPRFVAALMPESAARIEKTWDPIGLAGTGSHDIVVDNVLVPWKQVFDWPDGKPVVAYPTAIFNPGGWFISMSCAAVHIGLARRALSETRRELAGKKDRYSGTELLSHPSVLRVLEEAEGLLWACEAGVEKALQRVWSQALAGEPLSLEQRIQVRLACVTAVQEGARIVRSAFDVAGANAVRKSGVLERVLRDSTCLGQHVSTNAFSLETVGRIRGGFVPMNWRL